jgi:hypothetical protein
MNAMSVIDGREKCTQKVAIVEDECDGSYGREGCCCCFCGEKIVVVVDGYMRTNIITVCNK